MQKQTDQNIALEMDRFERLFETLKQFEQWANSKIEWFVSPASKQGKERP